MRIRNINTIIILLAIFVFVSLTNVLFQIRKRPEEVSQVNTVQKQDLRLKGVMLSGGDNNIDRYFFDCQKDKSGREEINMEACTIELSLISQSGNYKIDQQVDNGTLQIDKNNNLFYILDGNLIKVNAVSGESGKIDTDVWLFASNNLSTNSLYYVTNKGGELVYHRFAGRYEDSMIIDPPFRDEVKKNIPVQKRLLVSRTGQYSIILDHTISSKLILIDNVNKRVDYLDFFNGGNSQYHYSPQFVNESEIMFSLIDEDFWGTFRYSILDEALTIVSENFSDEIYLNPKSEVVLEQSFVDGANFPFQMNSANNADTKYSVRFLNYDRSEKKEYTFRKKYENGKSIFDYQSYYEMLFEALDFPTEFYPLFLSRKLELETYHFEKFLVY